MMNQDLHILLSIEEVSVMLHIGHSKVYTLLKSNKLTGYKDKRAWKVTRQSVFNYIDGKINQTVNSFPLCPIKINAHSARINKTVIPLL